MKKGIYSTYMLAVALIMADSEFNNHPPNKRKNKMPGNPAPKKKIIPKGCAIFTIEGVEIIATNEKNALRKYKNITNKNDI
jgi:hypothetical protein